MRHLTYSPRLPLVRLEYLGLAVSALLRGRPHIVHGSLLTQLLLVFALDNPDSFHILSQHLLDIVTYAESAKIFL